MKHPAFCLGPQESAVRKMYVSNEINSLLPSPHLDFLRMYIQPEPHLQERPDLQNEASEELTGLAENDEVITIPEIPPRFQRMLYKMVEFVEIDISKQLAPNSERYTLGEVIGRTLLQVLERLLNASGSGDVKTKLDNLEGASVKLDMLRLLIRLAKDCGCLPSKGYLELQAKLYQVGKMLGGWIKSY